MASIRSSIGASALVCLLAAVASPARAAAGDYRFELAGQPVAVGGHDTVPVRLVHVPDGAEVANAVIFESTADMGPMGMATMTGPVRALPPQAGHYVFDVAPGMTGTWALHLAAKVQGEAETVRGTLDASLVK